jgi:hypothetical protein
MEEHEMISLSLSLSIHNDDLTFQPVTVEKGYTKPFVLFNKLITKYFYFFLTLFQ